MDKMNEYERDRRLRDREDRIRYLRISRKKR